MMEMNTRLNADTADIRASLRAAYLQAREAGDHAEMSRLNALAVEVDSLRAKLALGALDNVARKVAAIRLGDLAGEDLPGSRDPMVLPPNAEGSEVPPPAVQGITQIAWGGVTREKHGPAFNDRVIDIARRLACDPSHLMAVMAFETGETFDPRIRNAAGSGATGLIQFLPATAKALGTSAAQLAEMTALRQLDFVEAYFAAATARPLAGLSDLYMAVLWPAAVGHPEAHILFREPSRSYRMNRGLDMNRDGVITKGEAAAKVWSKLAKGMKEGRVG